jgi:hypothetical protein
MATATGGVSRDAGRCQKVIDQLRGTPNLMIVMTGRLIRETRSENNMNDTPEEDIKYISDVYVNDFNRIAKSVESRCALTGERPIIAAIETQIALRAATQKITSLRRELTSIRSVVAFFLEEETWPEGIEERDWVMAADMEGVGQLHSGLVRTANEFAELGQTVSAEMTALTMDMNFPGSEEDAARALSGMSPERAQRKTRDKKSMAPITDRDFMELELYLSDHPHQNALKTLSTKRADSRALLRIFMRSIRITGMRPVEVFRCRILVGDQRREYTDADISAIYDAPYRAALKGTLIPIDAIDPRRFGSMAAMVEHTVEATGVPPILMIEAAKTTNANPELLRPYRAQILTGIEDEDLEVLCLAAHLHHFDMDKKRCSNLITTMTRNLTAAAKAALPRRTDPMNLYSFRHDFATRARRSLQIWEVAALMGHTAKASTYVYGKRNTRKKSGSGGWLPLHDEEFAEDIRRKWGMSATDENSPVDHHHELITALGLDYEDVDLKND